MINDILEMIRKAESEADVLIAEALESGRNIVNDANLTADEIRQNAVETVKAERKNVLETAENDGNIEYERILKAGQKEAERIRKSAKTVPAIEFIKGKVFSVNR